MGYVDGQGQGRGGKGI